MTFHPIAPRPRAVAFDAIGAGNIILGNLKAAETKVTGIPADNVIVGMSHSHSSADLQGLWGGVPNRWRTALYASAAEAVKEAVDNLKPVTLTVASGEVDHNNYRREGGDDPKAAGAKYVTEKTLTVLQARRVDGKGVVGTMIQYTAHPTVLGSSNRQVHTDWLLSGQQRLEAMYSGTGLIYNGPIVDASPKAPAAPAGTPAGMEGYERARLLGVGIANKAIEFLGSANAVELPVAPFLVRHTTVILPVTNPLFLGAGGIGWFTGYYNFTDPTSGLSGYVPTLVSRVRIGSATDAAKRLEIATIPGEGTGPFGRVVRGYAATPKTMTLGLTQNSLGYILPPDEFGRAGNNYEETVSLGPATAPELENLGYWVLYNESLPTTPAPSTPPR